MEVFDDKIDACVIQIPNFATIMEHDRSAIVAHVPDHGCTMRRMHEVTNKLAMVNEAELKAFAGQPLSPMNLQAVRLIRRFFSF